MFLFVCMYVLSQCENGSKWMESKRFFRHSFLILCLCLVGARLKNLAYRNGEYGEKEDKNLHI